MKIIIQRRKPKMKPKRNSIVKRHNNHAIFTIVIQRQIWEGRRKNQRLENKTIFESEEQKEKDRDEKWMEPERPIGHHLVHQYIRVPEKEERKENIWRNNFWKLPEFDERCDNKHLRSSVNSKSDKSKGTHAKRKYNHIVKSQSQRQNLERAR